MERFARVLVRWRWVVLAFWVGIGGVPFVRAPASPGLLNIRNIADVLVHVVTPVECQIIERALLIDAAGQKSAIDRQDLTRDEARRFRRQENGRTG